MFQFLERRFVDDEVLYLIELRPIDPDGRVPSFLAYAPAPEVDGMARSLSLHTPGHRVRVSLTGRTKAIYQLGERMLSYSIADSFDGLTDDEKRWFKITCSKTGELF